MASEEQDEYEALVDSESDSNKKSTDGSVELATSESSNNSGAPVTKGDPPPDVSDAELEKAQKRLGRMILFGDEVGEGDLHRVRICECLLYCSNDGTCF